MARAFRRYNNRLYFQTGSPERLKSDAQARAKKLRKKGFSVRIRKDAGKWYIYSYV